MEERGLGWILLAWIMLGVAGIMNIFQGIAAIDKANFWTDYGAVYVYSDLNTWGWIILIWGILEVVAAVSVWRGGAFGRWFGIGAAGINMILQLAFMPAYPFWALTIIVLDILVIYGLAVYGGRPVTD